MKYTEFIWDFDGTLADSYPAITRASMKALADHGIQAPFDEVYRKCKHSLIEMQTWYAQRYPQVSIPMLRNGYHMHSNEEGLSALPLYEGVREALNALKTAGGRHYLYTHRGPRALDALEYSGIAPLFSGCVNAASGFPNKPAPDALLYMMNVYGLSRSQCLMLGDRDIDMDAAKNAGIDCALFDPDGCFPDYKPTLSYTDYPALLKTLGV